MKEAGARNTGWKLEIRVKVLEMVSEPKPVSAKEVLIGHNGKE
jgi:hypothetical protein